MLWKTLVTGDGSGLGREFALLFAKGGSDVLSDTPNGKPQDPIDIANMVAFLCTEEERYITSQNNDVDGGIHSKKNKMDLFHLFLLFKSKHYIYLIR